MPFVLADRVRETTDDAGTGSDSGTIGAQQIFATDSGSLSESVLVDVSVSEAGAVFDIGSVAAFQSATDSGLAAELAVISFSTTDSGSSTENSEISISATESGILADVGSLVAVLTTTDAGSVIDAADLNLLTTDSGLAGDSADLQADIAPFPDRAFFDEVWSPGVTDGDTGLASDAAVLSVASTVADSGFAGDLALTKFDALAAEFATLADAAAVATSPDAQDAGAASETVLLNLMMTDAAATLEITEVSSYLSSNDSGIVVEFVSLLNILGLVVDTGVTADEAFLGIQAEDTGRCRDFARILSGGFNIMGSVGLPMITGGQPDAIGGARAAAYGEGKELEPRPFFLAQSDRMRPGRADAVTLGGQNGGNRFGIQEAVTLKPGGSS